MFSSLFFLATVVWMMFDDWNQPWKKYQRDFRVVEQVLAESEIEAIQTEGFQREEAELQAAIETAQAQLGSQAGELEEAEAVLAVADNRRYIDEQDAKFAKAEFDWVKYQIEEARKDQDDPTLRADELAAVILEMNRTAAIFETADLAHQAAQKVVDDLNAAVSEAEANYKVATRELQRASASRRSPPKRSSMKRVSCVPSRP